MDSANVISDRDTGRSKGFAFVEMSQESEAMMAIDKLNGMDLEGRAMNISEAKPQAPRDGQDLIFEIEAVSARAATEEELQTSSGLIGNQYLN